ncbi:uncharacterized protein LOC119464563 [Dermacentor silvarum]|uniref:uncharacterized protein LOC119464563 n=1 Tax=Dermacentor silvarum TaxID=543639 RepID=UPI00189BE31B|nr:uncharacterized protein LOC119464563 [Dermacentor silvarum]
MSLATKTLLLLLFVQMGSARYYQGEEGRCKMVKNEDEFDWKKFVGKEWMLALDESGEIKGYRMVGCITFTFYPKKGYRLRREYTTDSADPHYTERENGTLQEHRFLLMEELCAICDERDATEYVEILGTDYETWAVMGRCTLSGDLWYQRFAVLLKKANLDSLPGGIVEKANDALKKKGITDKIKWSTTSCILD